MKEKETEFKLMAVQAGQVDGTGDCIVEKVKLFSHLLF